MIKTKSDLTRYLIDDSRNFACAKKRRLKSELFSTPISDQTITWKYIKYLRLSEYAINTNNKILKLFYLWRLRHYSYMTGYQLPPNVCGEGLTIYHWGMIIVNASTKIGKKATFQPNVVIGKKRKDGGCPIIGDNFYICAGARVYGDVKIGNNVTIGPNCCVYSDVPDNSVVVGNPAYLVKRDGVKCLVKL